MHYGLTSVFDGWTRQCFDFETDYAGGRCASSWLDDSKVDLSYRRELGFYIAKKLGMPAFFSSKRQLAQHSAKETGVAPFIYANDMLKMSPEEFVTLDLEYQFELENLQGIRLE